MLASFELKWSRQHYGALGWHHGSQQSWIISKGQSWALSSFKRHGEEYETLLQQWAVATSLWMSCWPIYLNWNGHGAIMLPWDDILGCIPLRSRDRVEALSYHLLYRVLKEYGTPLHQWGATICLRLSFLPIFHTEMVKVVLWYHGVILCYKHFQEAQMESKLGLCIFLRVWKGVWTHIQTNEMP